MAKITKEEIRKVRDIISDTVLDGSTDIDERRICLLINIIGLFPCSLYRQYPDLEKIFNSPRNEYNV